MPAAIVLCAGFAVRCGGAAKPLLSVGGMPLLQRMLEWLAPVAHPIVVVTNDRHHAQYQGILAGFKVPHYLLNDGATSPETRLGAVGSALFAIDRAEKQGLIAADSDYMVVAGDNLVLSDAAHFLAFCREASFDWVVAGTPRPTLLSRAQGRFGVLHTNETGKVTQFEEKPTAQPVDGLVATGCLFSRRTGIHLAKRYAEVCAEQHRIPDAFGHFLAWAVGRGKRVGAYSLKGSWYDVGDPESLVEAEQEARPRGWTSCYVSDADLAASITVNGASLATQNDHGTIHHATLGGLFVKRAPFHEEFRDRAEPSRDQVEASALEREYAWTLRWHQWLPEVPTPLDFRRAKSSEYFLMELIDGEPVRESTESIVRQIASFIRRVHELPSGDLPCKRAWVVFNCTLIESLAALRRRFPDMRSLEAVAMQDFVSCLNQEIEGEFDEFGIGVVHGDPYLGNCLLNRSGALRVVDPSGGLVLRPFALDLGKLGQSILGGIEEVRQSSVPLPVRRLDPAWRDRLALLGEVYCAGNAPPPRHLPRIVLASTACCLFRSATRYDDELKARALVERALACVEEFAKLGR